MATSGLGGRNLMAARSQAQQLASRQPTASVDDLFPSPTNGRKRLRNIEALAATIATDGLNTALTVVPADHYLKHHPEHTEAVTQAGKPYVVLGGHRRLEAAKAAGLARVAINVVFEVKNIRIASLQENLQREPLTPVEEGEEFQRALTELSLSQRGLAKRLGAETNKRISQTYISQRIALLKLISELQDAVDDHWSGERDTGLTLKFAAEMLARLTHEAQRAFLKGQFSREDVAVATRRRSGELTTDDVTTVLRELAAERLAAGDGQTAADGVIAPQSPPPTATGTGAAEPTGSPEGAVVTAAGQATPDGVIAPQSPSPAVVSAGAAEPTGSPEGAVVTAAGQATPDGVIAPQSPSPAVVSAGAAEPTGSPEGAVVTAAGQATPDGVIAPQSPPPTATGTGAAVAEGSMPAQRAATEADRVAAGGVIAPQSPLPALVPALVSAGVAEPAGSATSLPDNGTPVLATAEPESAQQDPMEPATRVVTLSGGPEQVALAVLDALTAEEIDTFRNLLGGG